MIKKLPFIILASGLGFLIAFSPALADPASFFDTDLATGILSVYRLSSRMPMEGSAVFYERTFNSSMSTNIFEVDNDDGGSAWVRVTQNGIQLFVLTIPVVLPPPQLLISTTGASLLQISAYGICAMASLLNFLLTRP